jgi:hypothetical protein
MGGVGEREESSTVGVGDGEDILSELLPSCKYGGLKGDSGVGGGAQNETPMLPCLSQDG